MSYIKIMDIFLIRLNNLRLLIAQHGGPAKLGEKLGYANGSYLVQLAGPNPSRKVKEETARHIEGVLDLGENWLDTPRGNGIDPAPIKKSAVARAAKAQSQSQVQMTEVVSLVGTVLRGHSLNPPPDIFALLINLTWDHANKNGKISEDYVHDLCILMHPDNFPPQQVEHAQRRPEYQGAERRTNH